MEDDLVQRVHVTKTPASTRVGREDRPATSKLDNIVIGIKMIAIDHNEVSDHFKGDRTCVRGVRAL